MKKYFKGKHYIVHLNIIIRSNKKTRKYHNYSAWKEIIAMIARYRCKS